MKTKLKINKDKDSCEIEIYNGEISDGNYVGMIVIDNIVTSDDTEVRIYEHKNMRVVKVKNKR